jgi:hypothetical protein
VLLARLAALLCIPAVTLAVVNPAVSQQGKGVQIHCQLGQWQTRQRNTCN